MLVERDSIYAAPLGQVDEFRFDERVAQVFPDMISRSVPGYGTIITAIGLLARRFVQPNSRCYDLGCSLGGASIAMSRGIAQTGCEIVAIDQSSAMTERCRTLIELESPPVTVDVRCADIREVLLQDASMVVLNFTLQFIPVGDRAALIARIYQSLRPGGILVLSEKLAFEDSRQQLLHTELHHEFKRQQGYSDLEISQKRNALENVLIPESLACHRQRLEQAGFDNTEVWFQYFNFASMVAIR